MTTVDYRCKFCDKLGKAEYDPAVGINLSLWLPLLACNRCADYHEERLRTTDRIARTAASMAQLIPRLSGPEEPSDKLKQDLGKLRAALVFLTKRYSALVSRFYCVLDRWEPDLPDSIIERPELAVGILNSVARTALRTSRIATNHEPRG